MRKTKIICTLGPASGDEAEIEALARVGMNVARINLSHGAHHEQVEKIKVFRKVRERLGSSMALLLDTRGPEIRLKTFAKGKEILKEGQYFRLMECFVEGDERGVATSCSNLAEMLSKGDKVLIDDGRLELKVKSIAGGDVECIVVRGGQVSDNKGVNIPGVKLDVPYMGQEDRKDLLMGIENRMDYVAASFVRSGKDVKTLRSFLDENGGQFVRIIAKIENKEGIDNVDEILEIADGLMVARGDMGVEIKYEKIPGVQKSLIGKCRKMGKTSITATQMLESMTESEMPTRAEITDVANAVYDGTSAVMLSGETAVGRYPVETVEAMVKILIQAESDALTFKLHDNLSVELEPSCQVMPDVDADVSDAVAHAAYQAAKDLSAKAIIAVTLGGSTAQRMSKYRPETPIIAATPDKTTYYQQALTWGVYPIMTQYTDIWDELLGEAVSKTRAAGFIQKGDRVLVSAGMPLQVSGNTNLILIEKVN